MMLYNFSLGVGAVLAGSVVFYMASPHQRWWAKAWPARPARSAAVMLLAVGLWSLGQSMQAAAAAFVFLHVLMLSLLLLPYLGALSIWEQNASDVD